MVVVSAEKVSKAYRLGVVGGASLQEDFQRFWARIRRQPDPLLKVDHLHARNDGHGHFWALRDVSFEVNQGDVIGIIGRNGAGKSTLLKILSQVTGPTSGQIRLRGRIASLLEVGTGFHQDLTGRENVFLNGAILGMTKAEIRRKLDEIIDFSGVEEFIDTPVKRYSSGMNVRLAFAVAAHLEPEILIVDEVLAVGDAAFQKKCLGKMGDVARNGRTILFVSHDLGSVSRLCQRGILLADGRIESSGHIADVIAQYGMDGTRSVDGYADLSGRADRTGSQTVRLHSIELRAGSKRSAVFEIGSCLTAAIVLDVKNHVGPVRVAMVVNTQNGTPVLEMHNSDSDHVWAPGAGQHRLTVHVPKLRLYPGDYSVDIWIGDDQAHRLDYVKDTIKFQMVQTPDSGIGRTLLRNEAVVYERSEWVND